MIVNRCACEKSYISIIITFITQASLKYLQELGTFLAPQNPTQGRCELQLSCIKNCHSMKIVMHSGTALADFGIALVTTDQNVFIHVKKVYI